jgi:hypothetical protein
VGGPNGLGDCVAFREWLQHLLVEKMAEKRIRISLTKICQFKPFKTTTTLHSVIDKNTTEIEGILLHQSYFEGAKASANNVGYCRYCR